MAKNEVPVIKTFGDSSGLVRFYVCEEFSPKNGDQEFFGIVQLNKYKTWAFFSKNQIKDLKSDFKIKDLDLSTVVSSLFQSFSGFHFSKNKAKDERFMFNGFVLYLLIPKKESDRSQWSLDSRHQQFLKFKRDYTFLSIPFNDKPEVFFKKEIVCSYKKASACRFPDFNCNFTQQLKSNLNITDICKFLFGETTDSEFKLFKKTVIENFVCKSNSSSYEINFYFLALLRSLSRGLGNSALAELMTTNNLSKIAENENFEDLKNDFIGESAIIPLLEKCMGFLYSYNPAWAIKVFIKWDLPMERKFLGNFENFIEELKISGIEFQVDRYVSLLYFFNMMSKEYSKIKTLNFELPNVPESGLSLEFPDRIDEYKVVLAEDYKTLMQWGAYLHNCAGNFEQQNYYKDSISLGFYKDDKLQFLATIKEGNLTQLKGFKNLAPSKKVFTNTLRALLDLNIIKQSSQIYYKYESVCVQTYVYAE